MIPGKRYLVWGFVAIAVGCMVSTPLYSLVGFATAQDEEEEPLDILRVGFLQPVDSMNPMLGLNDASYIFYGLVYDNAHCIDKNMSIEGNLVVGTRAVPETDPELALTGRPYGSVWEYDISTNAMWHDGEPFSIEDFVWNINLHAIYYDTMWAFQPYSYFMEKAEKVDEDTARIYFFDRATEEPMPCAYAYLLAIPMLPRHLLSEYNAPYISFTWPGTFPDSDKPIVGTGPFMVTPEIEDEWTEGDHLTLVRNPNYHWDEDKGRNISFDGIVMYFYDDATSMRLALTSGGPRHSAVPARDVQGPQGRHRRWDLRQPRIIRRAQVHAVLDRDRVLHERRRSEPLATRPSDKTGAGDGDRQGIHRQQLLPWFR